MSHADIRELAPECITRARAVRAHAEAHVPHNLYAPPLAVLVPRVLWDAPAAGEIPRPVLADGQDLEEIRPDLADAIWHHVAGATILGPFCCAHPAGHRDALQTLAREMLAAATSPA